MTSKHPGCDCDSCSLRSRPFVPPEGVGREVCVLGEAPGKTEVVRQAPFVGDSGKILRTVLKHLGHEVHLTNSCLCQPLGNETPSSSDVRACWRGRAREELTNARVVVGVGNVPLEALTGETGITSKRGSARWLEDLGVWALFTYHPAYLLRFAEGFPDFLSDLRRIDQLLQWPEDARYDPCPMGLWHVADTPEVGVRLLRELLSEDVDGYVSLDLETTSLEWRKSQIVCGAITARGVTAVFDEPCWTDPHFRADLQVRLDSPLRCTFQNGAFDVKVLMRNGFHARCCEDTMLMHYTLDERKGTHGLEQLERKYLGVDKYKDDFEHAWQRVKEMYGKEAHYGMIRPRAILWEYNARDAYYTWVLASHLWELMDSDQRRLYQNLLIPLNNAKLDPETRGILMDREAMKTKEVEMALEVERLRQEMGALTGHPEINPNSPKQMCEVLYDELHIPRFRGKQRTTNKDALAVIRKKLANESVAAATIDKLRDYRRATKLLSTYLTGFYKWIDDDGMVRTEYLVHGTPTGRFASRNPNLQNIPRRSDIRDLFVAREGYTLVEGDYSQCVSPETRVLTSDLRWIPAGDLVVGDSLVGCDEQDPKLIKPSKVLTTHRITLPCCRITTETGVQLVCSLTHKWLVRTPSESRRSWKTSDHLRVGDTLSFYVSPWEEDTSWEGGWFSGLLDGEGYCTTSVGQTRVGLGHREGAVFNRALKIAQSRGFDISSYKNSNGLMVLNFIRDRAYLRVLGMFRPLRLLSKAPELLFRETKTKPHEITDIEFLGDQEVVSLETTTKTFVAEGYLTHNCELRVLAVLSGDKVLKQIFDEGKDLHNEVAIEFYGPNFTKDQRVRAKAVNFGIGYGRTAESIAEEYGIPLHEAKRYVSAWFGRFPQAAAFIKETRAKALRGEFIVNPSGRRRHFPLILPGKESEVQNEANNFPMQSTASDLTQMSMIELINLWQGRDDRRVALNVHDSIVAEVRDDVVDECVGIMKRVMERSAVVLLGDTVEFVVDVKVGKKWGSMKGQEVLEEAPETWTEDDE